jgi:hypothetical protein
MTAKKITVEDVVLFAEKNAGRPFLTLARRRPFKLHANKTGVRFDIPSGSYYPVNRSAVEKYVRSFNQSIGAERRRTDIYPAGLREGSYMTSTLFEIAHAKRKGKSPARVDSNDLEDIPVGCEVPDRAKTSGYRILRNQEVRRYIQKQGKGVCEYCGEVGFKMKNGCRYVETHHVIALSAEGEDTVDNVIALCSKHHREAHYGANGAALEKEFLQCIRERNRKRPNKAPL